MQQAFTSMRDEKSRWQLWLSRRGPILALCSAPKTQIGRRHLPNEMLTDNVNKRHVSLEQCNETGGIKQTKTPYVRRQILTLYICSEQTREGSWTENKKAVTQKTAE